MCERAQLSYRAVTAQQKHVTFDKHDGLAAVCKDADRLSLLSGGILLLRSEVNEYVHTHSSAAINTVVRRHTYTAYP